MYFADHGAMKTTFKLQASGRYRSLKIRSSPRGLTTQKNNVDRRELESNTTAFTPGEKQWCIDKLSYRLSPVRLGRSPKHEFRFLTAGEGYVCFCEGSRDRGPNTQYKKRKNASSPFDKLGQTGRTVTVGEALLL